MSKTYIWFLQSHRLPFDQLSIYKIADPSYQECDNL